MGLYSEQLQHWTLDCAVGLTHDVQVLQIVPLQNP